MFSEEYPEMMKKICKMSKSNTNPNFFFWKIHQNDKSLQNSFVIKEWFLSSFTNKNIIRGREQRVGRWKCLRQPVYEAFLFAVLRYVLNFTWNSVGKQSKWQVFHLVTEELPRKISKQRNKLQFCKYIELPQLGCFEKEILEF